MCRVVKEEREREGERKKDAVPSGRSIKHAILLLSASKRDQSNIILFQSLVLFVIVFLTESNIFVEHVSPNAIKWNIIAVLV